MMIDGSKTPTAPRLEQADILSSLRLLLQAAEYSTRLERDVWDFAVELPILRSAGLTNSQLRWLYYQNYVEHRCEVTQPSDGRRAFAPETNLRIDDSTFVILTTTGVQAARVVCETQQLAIAQPLEVIETPDWDDVRHELRWGGIVVKQYRTPSKNQQTILRAFEEDGWPPRIDDPLPQVPEIDPKRRLGDTIKSLNRKQRHPLLRFRGDGSGAGVRWELIAAGAQPIC